MTLRAIDGITPAAPRAVGVVLPVHDEQALLPAALESLDRALRPLALRRIRSHTAIVLDACSDGSEAIARRWSQHRAASVTVVGAGNVGAARKAGVEVVLDHFSELPSERLWLASTDADSQVPSSWLTGQVAHWEAGVGLWTGRVTVADWCGRPAGLIQRWRQAYAAELRPVHGASLGLTASTYLAAGGFGPLATGEDRALHDAAVATGAVTAHGGAPVVTSARIMARAPLGFAHALSAGGAADDDDFAAEPAAG